MGNFRWLGRALRELGSPTSLVEVGCGDGRFISQLAARGWKDLTAVDLAPPPPDLPENVTWLQQDVSSALAGTRGGILVANLFWHHFSDDQLAAVADEVARFDRIVLSEPHRSRWGLALGVTTVPFINHVTRHDLFVSVRAGFRAGELPELWRLRDHEFQFRESRSPLGAYRLIAWRN